jgi:periplasmic copper chaperone A
MRSAVLSAASVLLAGSAAAHVTLETREAAVGAPYKAVFKVPHGCKGAPTNAVRVRIPEGVIGVKPMPKPGWRLSTVTGRYARAYPYYHGATLAEGVVEVVWSGGDLPDAFYDEFVLQAFLTEELKPGSPLHFPVVQECPDGATARWIEVPAEGEDPARLEAPAPALRLLPKR